MSAKNCLQKSITRAAETGLIAVRDRAFELHKTQWRPRVECLVTGYSSGERVLCGILLCYYFLIYEVPDYVLIPEGREHESKCDIVWSGAYSFYHAAETLSDRGSWEAIKMLLPGE